MKKILIALFLLFNQSAFSDTYVGIAQGHHIVSKGLNNTHAYAGYEDRGYGIVLFQNSFNRISGAVYKDVCTNNNTIDFCLKAGVVAGYKRVEHYNNHTYLADYGQFITSNLSFMVVPAIKYNINESNVLDISMLGDSIQVGLTYVWLAHRHSRDTQ